jgi:adenylate cyclase
LLAPKDIIRIGEHLITVFRPASSGVTGALIPGTQTLTRDVVLESIDQHAVLMYDAARKLNTVMDVESALREVSSMIRVSLGADRCEVILPEAFDQMRELGFPMGIARMAIDRRAVVNIPDIALEEERIRESASLLRIRSVLCVPVLSGEEVMALIYMYKTSPADRPFDQQDVQLAVAISHQAALTLQRMQLMERVSEEQRVSQMLQRFVSPSEVEFILKNYRASGTLPGLSQQHLTVLFADISDSTGLAERLGPMKFGEILTKYYQEMTNIVFEHNGLVDKYLGDGIMAVFGMTGDTQEQERRAVGAGLSMLERVERLFGDLDERLCIGVGINTGEVVAGYVGSRHRVELTVLGDTVNVAAGLQTMARPNRLIIGPATQAAVVGRFETQRVGLITVKGRTRDIQGYEVLRPAP